MAALHIEDTALIENILGDCGLAENTKFDQIPAVELPTSESTEIQVPVQPINAQDSITHSLYYSPHDGASQVCQICQENCASHQTLPTPTLWLIECNHWFHKSCLHDYLVIADSKANVCEPCRSLHLRALSDDISSEWLLYILELVISRDMAPKYTDIEGMMFTLEPDEMNEEEFPSVATVEWAKEIEAGRAKYRSKREKVLEYRTYGVWD